MTAFFITARSFAAPFFSDESEKYVEAPDARSALERYAGAYSHPAGLYAAEAWASADDYHKSRKPLARWLSNHARELARITEPLSGYSLYGHGPGDVEVNGERHKIDDPKGGSVVPA
jgi:hypothetical protein